MAAIPLNLTIEQGVDFEVTLTVRNKNHVPLNLLGYTAVSTLRKYYTSTSTQSITVNFLDRSNGRISLTMTDTDTSALKEGRYVYDVLFIDNTTKKSIVIEGNVLATEDISDVCVKTSYLYSGFGVIPESDGISNLNNVTSITINGSILESIVKLNGSKLAPDLYSDIV